MSIKVRSSQFRNLQDIYGQFYNSTSNELFSLSGHDERFANIFIFKKVADSVSRPIKKIKWFEKMMRERPARLGNL